MVSQKAPDHGARLARASRRKQVDFASVNAAALTRLPTTLARPNHEASHASGDVLCGLIRPGEVVAYPEDRFNLRKPLLKGGFLHGGA